MYNVLSLKILCMIKTWRILLIYMHLNYKKPDLIRLFMCFSKMNMNQKNILNQDAYL